MCDIINTTITGLDSAKIFIWSFVLGTINIFDGSKTFYTDEFKSKMITNPDLITHKDIYYLINISNNIIRHYNRKQSYNYTHCVYSSKYVLDIFFNIFENKSMFFMFDEKMPLILSEINKNCIDKNDIDKNDVDKNDVDKNDVDKNDIDKVYKDERYNYVHLFLNTLYDPEISCVFNVRVTCYCYYNCTNSNDLDNDPSYKEIPHSYIILKIKNKYWKIQSYICEFTLMDSQAITEIRPEEILDEQIKFCELNGMVDSTGKIDGLTKQEQINMVWKKITGVGFNYDINKYDGCTFLSVISKR